MTGGREGEGTAFGVPLLRVTSMVVWSFLLGRGKLVDLLAKTFKMSECACMMHVLHDLHESQHLRSGSWGCIDSGIDLCFPGFPAAPFSATLPSAPGHTWLSAYTGAQLTTRYVMANSAGWLDLRLGNKEQTSHSSRPKMTRKHLVSDISCQA